MLQHNWAIVLESEGYARILFYCDTCGIFDEIAVSSTGDAVDALVRNGFAKFREDTRAQKMISLPKGEFSEREHPNGRIYSSGRFWK